MSDARRIALSGCRVLLVEDEFMIALLIEEALEAQGCAVVGPCATLADGLRMGATAAIDLAVLDVNLRGEKVYPLAELLERRGIPFVLLSGYGAEAVPPEHPGWCACTKPFSPEDLLRAIEQQLAGHAGRGGTGR